MKSLYNSKNQTFYIGLLPKLIKWLQESNYEYSLIGDFNNQEFSIYEADQFIKTLNLSFNVRDYQKKYFIKSVRNKRAILHSPTSSGKSLIAYLIFRYFNKKTLIIVPTTSLVVQMKKDFENYGYNSSNIHVIYEGKEKNTDKIITISTWQSLVNQNKDYFNDFDVIIGDEAHGFKSKSLVNIMEKMNNTSIRIAMTGTLTSESYDDNLIEGLFGPVIKYISTSEMIKQGYSSPLIIKAILLNHVKSPYKNNIEKIEYTEEIKYLINNVKRNNFISNLALSLKGNTFIMFRFKEHGHKLYNVIKEKSTIPVYFIDGDTSVEERENVRKLIENSEESITIASVVFSTGVNITTVNNIIFTTPSKKKIRILQSIGRGLRLNENKKMLEVFDIGDQLCDEKKFITYLHFIERLKLYKSEGFKFKIYNVNL